VLLISVAIEFWFLESAFRTTDQLLSMKEDVLFSSAPFSSLPFSLNFFSVVNVTSITSESGIESMIFVSWGLANRMKSLFHTTRLVCHVLF
jgi:hypothetical protein